MSLILDAINKSEREKDSSETVPDLQTVHASPAPLPANSNKVWLVVVGSALALLLSLLIVLMSLQKRATVQGEEPSAVLQREPSAERQQEPSAGLRKEPSAGLQREPSAGLQQRPSAGVKQKPLAQSSQQPSEELSDGAPTAMQDKMVGGQPSANTNSPNLDALGDLSSSDEVAALYGDATEAKPLVIQPTKEPATVIQPSDTQTKQTSVDEELAKRLWQEAQRMMPSRPVASNREQPKAAEPVAPATINAPIDETLAAFEGTPYLHELSVSVQNSIPTLMYASHKYDEQRVVINKKTYRQGEDIGGGVVIESILADGLILNFNSYQFKLSALNSWVNY